NIVISQFYGGGGLAGAQYTNDFVELYNRGNAPVNLNGWSVQYGSATGSTWLPAFPLPNFSLQPGQYFLLQFASNGTVGSALPTPDFVVPVLQPEGFIPNLSSTNGKLALVNISTRLPAAACPADPSIVDLVGYGSANCSETAATPALIATTAGIRKNGGNTDTDNNNADFTIGTPVPRNSSTQIGSFQASIAASPTSVTPGGNTLFTVTVIPATTPPSTGITVVADLTGIGGLASQTFFDNGTNGDVTPNDNVFSFLATIPVGTVGGNRSIPAVASDAQARTVNLNQNINVNAPLPDEDPLLLGNPSNATPDIANENNYLLVKPQYTLSHNRSKATPNWVAWRLDSNWLGSTPRQDDFRPDPSLPAGWYQVTDTDYSGSGYDRGHMCPSGDRTNSVANNSATFLMTNFVPQLPANNQGPWEDFESYCRTLAGQGNEIYIVSGPVGNIGTIANGRIVVPQSTWKVVLVLPNGTNDLQRITRATRTIGIIVPNQPPLNINAPWRDFRVSVDTVENLTGFNFFSNVPKNTQELIERRKDTQ
ncbi:MAG: DNA/RNA non-specific endonuclease, partial [Actinomycetota bacterium]